MPQHNLHHIKLLKCSRILQHTSLPKQQFNINWFPKNERTNVWETNQQHEICTHSQTRHLLWQSTMRFFSECARRWTSKRQSKSMYTTNRSSPPKCKPFHSLGRIQLIAACNTTTTKKKTKAKNFESRLCNSGSHIFCFTAYTKHSKIHQKKNPTITNYNSHNRSHQTATTKPENKAWEEKKKDLYQDFRLGGGRRPDDLDDIAGPEWEAVERRKVKCRPRR